MSFDPSDAQAWRDQLRRSIEADPPHDSFESREMRLELEAVADRLALLFRERRLPEHG